MVDNRCDELVGSESASSAIAVYVLWRTEALDCKAELSAGAGVDLAMERHTPSSLCRVATSVAALLRSRPSMGWREIRSQGTEIS